MRMEGKNQQTFPHLAASVKYSVIFHFQGQFGQANYVMKLYNFTKTNGFFFEAGAHDGVIISNTLLMETRFNWTGMCSEPILYGPI